MAKMQKRVTFAGALSLGTQEEQKKRSVTLQQLYKGLLRDNENNDSNSGQQSLHSSNSSQERLDRLYEQMIQSQMSPIRQESQRNVLHNLLQYP